MNNVNDRPRRPPKTDTSRPGWLQSITAYLKPIVLALTTSVASIVAYVATPLQEMVNAAIWDEKASIELVSQNHDPKEGDVIAVDVFIQPLSPVSLSDGILEIQYSKGTLKPGGETSSRLTTTTSKLGSAKRMFEPSLEFIAEVSGDAYVTATLKTNRRATFTKTLSFKIQKIQAQDYPTRRNFSGLWNIDLGGISGRMELKDLARTLTGSYTLTDGSRGQVEGTRDGKTRISILRQAKILRCVVRRRCFYQPETRTPHGNTTSRWTSTE